VLESLDRSEHEAAIVFLEKYASGGFCTEHIRVRLLMDSRHFEEAKRALQDLLDAENPLSKVGLYVVLCELEICCRETDDYKNAYHHATEKVQLLEELLREI
jgi:hypothetical protein